MKDFLFVLLFIPAVSIAQSGTIHKKVHQSQAVDLGLVEKRFEVQSDSIAPDSTGIRSVGSVSLCKEMVPGWNVGNSLDAIGGETAWGNPLISQRLIDSVKAAGFKAIRIPVAWSKFSDASTFTIDTNFMKRVEQVVNYVLKDSMYAIVNIHWDNGWMQPTYMQQTYVNNRLAKMWHQIAVRFRDYNDHLLFAGTNEVMVTGNYNAPTKEYYTVQNSFNQTFVTTVRSTGGRNVYRYLAVQGFNTNIDYTVSYFTIPTDVTTNRLVIEDHYYDPYDFTLNTSSTITQWGKYATVPSKTETWADEPYADGQFQKLKTNFIDKGYGVIIGEYGAMARLNLGSNALNTDYAKFRLYYMQYITRSIVKHGLVPFYWDNGGTGNYGMGLFNRATGAQGYPDIIKAVVDTSGTVNFSTDIKLTGSETLKLYPNPAKDVLILELTGKSINNCELYNENGKIIRILKVVPGINTYDISNLKPGLYFIKIVTQSGITFQKLVKY